MMKNSSSLGMTSKLLILVLMFATSKASIKVLRISNDGKQLELEVQLPESHEKEYLNLTESAKFGYFPMTVSHNKLKRTFSSHLLKDSAHVRYNSVQHGAVVSVQQENGKMAFQGHFNNRGKHYRIESLGDGNHEVTLHQEPPELPVPSPPKQKIGSLKMKKKNNYRVRRQSNTSPSDYVVEIYLLLDHKVWEHFASTSSDENQALSTIYKYYTHILDGIDMAYRGLEGISMSIECVGILIAKTAADAEWIDEADLSGPEILAKLESYYMNNGLQADHFMAFTRYDIYGLNGDSTKATSVVGMAPVGAVCKQERVSINEDSGLHSWTTAAHELGHNMDASHDGNGNNACSGSTYNIMSAGLQILGTSNVQNSIKFSSCSTKAIKDFVELLDSEDGSSCLKTKTGTRKTELTDPTPIGRIWNLDTVCKHAYGSSSSFFLQSQEASDPSLICASIYCSSPSGDGVSTGGLRAPNGTPCGSKKSCNWEGKCVADENAPTADEKCFFGDSDTKESCEMWLDVMTSYPDYCDMEEYKNYVKTSCCETCASVCN